MNYSIKALFAMRPFVNKFSKSLTEIESHFGSMGNFVRQTPIAHGGVSIHIPSSTAHRLAFGE